MPSFADFETLVEGPVTVRLAAERDIPEVLLAYQDDPELHVRMGQLRPPSGAELGRLAERAPADRETGRGLGLTIVSGDSDVCLGQVYVHHVAWEHYRVELGIWVAPQARGQGLARVALRLVGSWLLRETGLQRVQLLTETGNEPLISAAQAAGFQPEGVLRGYLLEQGRRVDTAVLSLVSRDLAG